MRFGCCLTLQRSFWSTRNVPLHETVRYQNALVAIIAAKLCDSGRNKDTSHGMWRLFRRLPRLRVALEAHTRRCGMPLADRELMRTAIEGAFAEQPKTVGEPPSDVVVRGEVSS